MSDSPRSTPDDAALQEAHTLALVCLEGTATSQQRSRLERLVCENPAVEQWYVLYMHESLLLRRLAVAERQRSSVDVPFAYDRDIADIDDEMASFGAVDAEAGDENAQPGTGYRSATLDTSSVSTFPATRFQGTSSYFSSDVSMAYLLATIIVGIGLAIMAAIPVYQTAQNIANSKPVMQRQPIFGQKDDVVGRITGMVDCKWNGTQSRAVNGDSVELGQKYSLASGLLEITYDTGAKVILQSPVTYEVESANGGILSAGKLTGEVTTETARGLTIRTPTAIVTDLGTEFGVEVDQEGHTTSYVFRGTVSIHAINGDKDTQNEATVLHANESAHTERAADGDHRTVVRRVAIEPRRFFRQLKSDSLVDVLAWFRMGEDEPNAVAGMPAGKEIHCHNKKRVHLDRHGSPTYSADTEAPGSSLSMTFHGDNDDHFCSSRFPFIPNDYFILEAWVKLRTQRSEMQFIAGGGQGAQDGYCLAIISGRWHGVLQAIGWSDSGVACEIGKWTHLALVCERGRAQLWINGRPVGNVVEAIPNMPDGPFTIGGEIGYPKRAFDGEIDEVRLSTFIAPFRPEMLLFGRPK